MEKILLCLQSPDQRQRVRDWLAADYEVWAADTPETFGPPCDLAIIDPPSWEGWKLELEARKGAEAPAFLPVLLVVSSLEDPVWVSENGGTVDEVIRTPLELSEFSARVANLLRTRRWSRQTAIIAGRQAEEALKEANERLTALIETSPLAIIALDADDRVTTWNPAAERTFGWTKEEVLEKPLPLVPPEMQERFRTRRARDMQGESFIGLEVEALKREGSRIAIKLSAAPLYDASGKITGSIGIAEDISAWKQTEQELARLASFPQLNPNPVLEVDLAGRITFYNQALLTALDLLGLSEAADFLPEDLPEMIRAVREQRATSFYREKKSGKAVFGQRIHVADPFEVLRIYAFNITEMKKTEEALRRAKDEWERTFDAVPDLIAILDQEHHLLRVNRSMADLLGMAPEQATGLKCYEAVHHLTEAPAFCPHSLLLADGQEHTAEVHERGRDFLVTASPLRDSQGRVIGSVHVARDITEHKRAEAALRESQRDLNRAQAVAHTGSWRLEVRRNQLLWSEETYRIFGISPGTTLTYETFLATVHPEDREFVDRKWTAALRGEPYDIEHRIVVGDTVKWVRERAELEFDPQGLLLGGFGTVQDITQHKKAEETMRRQAELLNLAQDAILVRDSQDRIVFWNQGAEEYYGWPREEALGNISHQLLNTEFPQPLEEIGKELLDSGHWEGELVHTTRDGRRLTVAGRWALRREEPGEPPRILEINYDITQRKRAEAALQKAHAELELRVAERTAALKDTVEQLEREVEERLVVEATLAAERQRFYSLLEELPAFIYLQAPDYSVRFANRQFRERFGDPNGKSCYTLIWGRKEPCPECPTFSVFHTGTPKEWEWQAPDGRIYQVYDYPFADVDGSPLVLEMGIDITERKRIEAALELERQRLFAVMEQIPAYVVLISPDCTIPYANREFIRRFGDPGNRLCYEFLFGLEAPCEGCKALEVFKNGTPAIWEWSGPDGNIYQIYDYPFTDVDGSPLVLELGVDITDRRRTEEALRESEERFAMFMRHLPGAALMRDTQGRYVFANDTWEQTFGKKQPEWQGKTLEEVWPPEFAAYSRILDQEVLQGRQATQSIETFPSPQGERHFLTSRFPILDQAGNPVLLGGIGIDITARQQAEAALREKTRILDAFFAHSLTPLVILDRDFNFIRVNQAYAQACQRAPEEFAGCNHFELYPHQENQAIFANVVRTRIPYQAVAKPFEFPDHPEWGVTYWDWSLVPILNEAGEVEFLVFSLRDVTVRQRAEEAIKESEQKLRLLTSQILTVQEQERRRLSRELHDGLGQALLVFKLQVRAIERNLPAACENLKEDCRHTLRFIDEVIEDIRRLSRDLSPSVLEDIGLAAAIKNLCEEFSRLHELEVFLDLDEVEEELSKEAQINIFRIVQESLTNISKYADASRIDLAIKKEDPGIAFCIRDDGIGFPMEDTLARRGSNKGMGLAAMDERVRMLGGALRVMSTQGAGTTITFTIPRRG